METATIHHEVALANTAAEVRRLQSHRHANFISIESYLAWMADEELLQIFQAVANLPTLRTFRISFSFQRFRQLPVLPVPCQGLVAVLDAAHQLEHLTLDEVTFSFRDTNDLMALATALQRASTLKLVTLFNCFPLEPPPNVSLAAPTAPTSTDSAAPSRDTRSTNSTNYSDRLAHALANVPSLEELNLIFTREGPEWICALLKQSCSSHTMKVVRINVPDGSFLGDPLQCLCRALESNATLRELSIRCPLDAAGGVALARALKSPTISRLEQLYIQLKNYNYAIPIAEALHTNRHLKSLELRVWTGGDRSPLLAAYETMVLRNPVIQELIIDNGRLGLTPLIDFYLTLNLHDRRRLLERGDKLTKQAWIDFLVRLRPNLSGLFYTLSLNPTLCEPKDGGFPVADAWTIGDQARQKRQRRNG